jgi:hypothetical protein
MPKTVEITKKNVFKENIINKKGKQIVKKTVVAQHSSSDSDDEEAFCLVCLGPFSNSAPKEKWIQCTQCKVWSHEQCCDAGPFYICHNCESD